MLFNSYFFILLFLPVVLLGYFFCNRAERFTLGKLWLLAASFLFYGYMNPVYVLLLAGSILVNFWFSQRLTGNTRTGVTGIAEMTGMAEANGMSADANGMDEVTEDSSNKIGSRTGSPATVGSKMDAGGKRGLLIAALAINVGLLFLFKYYNFFAETTNSLFASDFSMLNIAMPLGISFITFQQIAWLVDSYKRDIPEYSILDYAVFVSFFPKLISGPIALHKQMIPQFQDKSRAEFRYENFAKGLYAFSFGLAKKVLLASAFAGAADYGFQSAGSLSSTIAVLSILAYTFQLYFDFSGYCDMATGIGWMLNIEIPINFNSPYRAVNINDFWSRWHITLTNFFTKYVYIPLGGNRKGTARTYLNCMIVFLLSGLWHGAAWTFVLWGALHGMATVIDRAGKAFFSKLPRWFMWAMTFGFINVAWVFFRADSIWQALSILKRVLTGGLTGIPEELSNSFLFPEFEAVLKPLLGVLGDPVGAGLLCTGLFYIFAILAVLVMKNTNERIDGFVPTTGKAALCTGLLFWSISSLTGVSSFVYFNF